MEQERRRQLRFRFDAAAELFPENTEAALPARVTEISPNGCYLQMAAPLEVGSSLLVKIFVDGWFFEAHASVLYAHPNSGMGVGFRDLKPYFGEVLRKWLLAAMLAKHKPQD
jgi:hypothetical protein